MNEITDARTPVPLPGVARLPNIHALTSVRFFAALHVALYHLVRPFTLWGPLADTIGAGYIGVSFFFVLSGFILTYSHAAEYESGKGQPVRFWVARFARIYPVYFLSMLIAAYVERSQFHPAFHILAFASDLVMLQSWSMRMISFFNVPAWTLSCEAFFYLVFPFLFLKMRPSSHLKAWLWIVGMWALAMALPLYCTLHYPILSWNEFTDKSGEGAMAVHELFVRRVRKLPIFALPEFMAGISMAWLYLRFRPSQRVLAWMTGTGLVALVAVLAYIDRLPFIMLHNGLLIPVFALLTLGLCGRNWFSRLLENKGLILLGEASFSLYLIHFLFKDFLRDQFGVGEGLGSITWKLAILIPLSVLLHLYLERPGRKVILKYWHSRKAVATG